jgi:serine acetyltransferase
MATAPPKTLPTEAPPQRKLGVFALIWSDYMRHCRDKGEDRGQSIRRAPVRLLLNPSLRAVIVVRLTLASPWFMHWFWRTVLITFNSMEIDYQTRIGPGLLLPHPIAIALGPGATFGRDVTICHNVSVGGNLGRGGGVPKIGDDVILFPGCVVVGELTVGDGAIIGANTFLDHDVPPGGTHRPPRSASD